MTSGQFGRSHWKVSGAALGLALLALPCLARPAGEAPLGHPLVIAHRGVYQTFDHKGLDPFAGCTATRIYKPVHRFLENTIPSIREAYRLGADMVEIDVAPTRDGDVAVFHDWTLDCRTDGHGEIRDRTLAELKALDIGYGYTADGGRSFPFRGHGIGLMPSLEEVLHAFPGKRLLINFKSKDANEADAVAAAFAHAGVAIDGTYGFYGGSAAVRQRMRKLAPRAWIFDARACSLAYLKQGLAGPAPDACRGDAIGVPINLRERIQGWPGPFLERMAATDTKVILFGDADNMQAPLGLTRPDQLDAVPAGYDGLVWVEDIWALRGRLRALKAGGA